MAHAEEVVVYYEGVNSGLTIENQCQATTIL